MWNVCYSGGMLLGPILCSWLVEVSGFAGMLAIVGGGVAAWGVLVAIVFAMLASRTEEDEAEELEREEEEEEGHGGADGTVESGLGKKRGGKTPLLAGMGH